MLQVQGPQAAADTSSWVPIVLDVIKVAGGAFLGVVGKSLGDRRRAKKERQEEARGLVACMERIDVSLERTLHRIDNVSANPAQLVVAFFKEERDLIAPQHLTELYEKVPSCRKLDQACLRAWREAEEAARKAQDMFEGLRVQSGLHGNRGGLIAALPTLRTFASDARQKLQAAAKALRACAAKDTRRMIDSISDGGR